MTDVEKADASVENYLRRVRRRGKLHNAVTSGALGLMFGVLGSMLGTALQHHDRGNVIRSAIGVVLEATVYWEVVLRPNWRDR